MAMLQVTSDLQMYYEVTDFAEPWREHETILLLHGNAESGEAWYGWMPEMARDYRVVRPDMRGFGRSTPMPRDYAWSLDRIVDDFVAVMDDLEIDRFYLVGAKVGGTMALHLAARHPSRVKTVSVLSAPTRGESAGDRYRAWVDVIDKRGVEGWARDTMAKRLGAIFPPGESYHVAATAPVQCAQAVLDFMQRNRS